MSVETPKTVEETPVVAPKIAEPAVESPVVEPTPATTETPAATETPATTEPVAPVTEELKKGETVVEAVPASEGVLGYKEPGLLKQFYFSKHFFWFNDEPSTSESLATYLRTEKKSHEHAAWARETGKGVMFFSKRAEDKATPSGLIMLSEVSNVTKEGTDRFSFKVGAHNHRFEAATAAERDSWVVAIEKKAEEAKGMKEEITGRESYKKNMEELSTPAMGVIASKTDRSKSKEPQKSLGANPATATTAAPAAAATTQDAVPKADNASSSSNEEKKKINKKERSQSRKRASIFGSLLGKKDERDEQKEMKKEEVENTTPKIEAEKATKHAVDGDASKDIKAEEKAEKKAEKEALKEEKKAEKKAEKEALKEEKKAELQHKKEEVKATHDANTAAEAAEAGAVAAVPGVALAAEKKHEGKETEVGTTEKKNKRNSVFGGFFGKKGVTSPTSEKNEHDVAFTPVKDSEVPPVSETAPKIEEPIENKPIDAAAVTAPADKIAAESATLEPSKEPATVPVTTETATTPKAEKKGGFLGFIKKTADTKKDSKEEVKAEEVGQAVTKDSVTAAAAPTEPATETATTTTDSTVPVAAPTSDERAARKERRTSSFFSGLGTMKKKTEPVDATEEATVTETKREKSPLPKIGGLFRKATKSGTSEVSKDAATTTTDAPVAGEATSATTGTATEPTASAVATDAPAGEPHLVHDEVTTTPEVKATA